MKALIFDMDGLMIDSERLYDQTQRELAARFDREYDPAVAAMQMGRKPVDSMRIFAEQLNIDMAPEELAEIRETRFVELLKSDLTAMAGLVEIVDAFKGQVKLAVATGSPQHILDFVVDELEIRNDFDVLQSSDEIVEGKPDPEIYLRVLDQLGVTPIDGVVLEDSENGVRAGKAAGCCVIAVPNEHTRTHDFSVADYVAKDLHEVIEYLGSEIRDLKLEI